MTAHTEFHNHCVNCPICSEAKYSWQFCETGARLWTLSLRGFSPTVAVFENFFNI